MSRKRGPPHTSVTLNGQPIPLFFVSPGQINAQLPFQIQSGSAQLAVRDGTGATGSRTISIAPTSPGVFSITADGKGEAISVHADFTLVRRVVLEYAKTGETIVLFCTGLGAVSNFATSGAAAPYSPLSQASAVPTVLMGGRPAQVTFAGLAPGFVGLYQINFVVPSGVGGDVVTTVVSNGVTSNATTINVAGTYTLAANYSGQIAYRNGGPTYKIDLSQFATISPGRFGAQYRVLNGTTLLDAGSFQLESTETVFTAKGQSSVVVPGTFVGVLDTLDAGNTFFGVLYNATSLDNVQDADSWYASFTFAVSTPTPPPPPPPTLPGVGSTCAAVEGILIYAADGRTFLGLVTSNTYAADSIGNPYGRYGSEYSSTSIFNKFGTYGSQVSSTSAFNDLASSPPILYRNSTAVAYLTTNSFKTPRIDPRALIPCIGR